MWALTSPSHLLQQTYPELCVILSEMTEHLSILHEFESINLDFTFHLYWLKNYTNLKHVQGCNLADVNENQYKLQEAV